MAEPKDDATFPALIGHGTRLFAFPTLPSLGPDQFSTGCPDDDVVRDELIADVAEFYAVPVEDPQYDLFRDSLLAFIAFWMATVRTKE